MATPQERDELLWAAMESGRLDESLAGDTEIAGAFKAHQKLESLFALLRQPADVLSDMGDALDHPTTIGRYQICRVLGRGGFGTVYLADDPELDRQVAIKVSHPNRFSSQQDADRFLEEAKIAAGLKHPAIVTVHDVGREGNRCYIVMEYIPGHPLDDVIQWDRLPLQRVTDLVARIADALHYAHKEGFVHRDLKPDNVLIDSEGNPHVSDFGLAVSEVTQRPLAGQVAGTPAYMSPEQVRGETHYLDGRTDIWSLGVIFYQLLTGQHPFWRGDAAECLDQIQHREPKPPRQVDDSIPVELERIAMRCLSKQVTDRYATAGDLARDLRHQRVSRRRLIAMIPAAVLAIVVPLSLFAIWYVAKGRPTPTPQALSGMIDVQIWGPDNAQRGGLTESGALPLRSGDQIRLTVSMSQPSYPYVVWITPDGKAAPVYPWAPGNWDQRPEQEGPVSYLSLPEQAGKGWPVQGPAGMETLVLLARATPLPAEIRLRELLSDFPRQEIQDPRAIVWLDQGKVVDTRERAPQFFNPQEIDDPVLATQRLLAKRLKPHFQLIRAVSFANVALPGE